MDTVRITPIELLNTDDRGYVAEYSHERAGRHLLVFSNAGAVRGRHYHKGASAAKNPEMLILVSGSCTLHWKLVGSGKLHTVSVIAPAKLEIFPNVWHELVMQTDCAIVELNSIEDHAADTYYDV